MNVICTAEHKSLDSSDDSLIWEWEFESIDANLDGAITISAKLHLPYITGQPYKLTIEPIEVKKVA